MIIEKGIFNLAVELLNIATDSTDKLLLISRCRLVDNEIMDYSFFMEACESIPENSNKFIPDYVAKVYNTLVDAIDNRKFAFPSNEEIDEAKGQIRKLNRRNISEV